MAFFSPQFALSLAVLFFSFVAWASSCCSLIKRQPIWVCRFWFSLARWMFDLLLVVLQIRFLHTHANAVLSRVLDFSLRFCTTLTVCLQLSILDVVLRTTSGLTTQRRLRWGAACLAAVFKILALLRPQQVTVHFWTFSIASVLEFGLLCYQWWLIWPSKHQVIAHVGHNLPHFMAATATIVVMVLGGVYPEWQRLLTMAIHVATSPPSSVLVAYCEIRKTIRDMDFECAGPDHAMDNSTNVSATVLLHDSAQDRKSDASIQYGALQEPKNQAKTLDPTSINETEGSATTLQHDSAQDSKINATLQYNAFQDSKNQVRTLDGNPTLVNETEGSPTTLQHDSTQDSKTDANIQYYALQDSKNQVRILDRNPTLVNEIEGLPTTLQHDSAQDSKTDANIQYYALQDSKNQVRTLDGNPTSVNETDDLKEVFQEIIQAKQRIRQRWLLKASISYTEDNIRFEETTCHKCKVRSKTSEGKCGENFCQHVYCFMCRNPGRGI